MAGATKAANERAMAREVYALALERYRAQLRKRTSSGWSDDQIDDMVEASIDRFETWVTGATKPEAIDDRVLRRRVARLADELVDVVERVKGLVRKHAGAPGAQPLEAWLEQMHMQPPRGLQRPDEPDGQIRRAIIAATAYVPKAGGAPSMTDKEIAIVAALGGVSLPKWSEDESVDDAWDRLVRYVNTERKKLPEQLVGRSKGQSGRPRKTPTD